jgi:hypothetical protein
MASRPIVRVVLRALPERSNVAVIVVSVGVEVGAASIANTSLAEPAGIVTLAGTDAAVLLLTSETRAPPSGAGAVSMRVPRASAPAVMAVGDTEKL